MKFINKDGEIVEGEPVSPVEEQALNSFRKKLDELPEYLTERTKSRILKILANHFVIQPRSQAVQEPEYMNALMHSLRGSMRWFMFLP